MPLSKLTLVTRSPNQARAQTLTALLLACCTQLACSAADNGPPSPTSNTPSSAGKAGGGGASGGNPSSNVAGKAAGGAATAAGGNGGTSSEGGSSSGTGGSGTGTAGGGSIAGSGGGPVLPVVCPKSTGADPLIDDLEDSNIAVKEVDGRTGIWESFDDSSLTGMYTARYPMGEGHGGGVGWCTDISGYTEWGANLVANLADPKCGYDASPYSGLCFWAKGGTTAGGPIVFAVGTNDTVPAVSGGKCPATGACNAHYEVRLSGDNALTDEYQEYCFAWDELGEPSIAMPKPFDPTGIVQIEWKFPAGAGVSTDGTICVDDLRFQE